METAAWSRIDLDQISKTTAGVTFRESGGLICVTAVGGYSWRSSAMQAGTIMRNEPSSSDRRIPGAIIEDQTDVVAFLSDPATHDGCAVRVIETHGAMVFLAGDRAIKLKRAVWFPYMDFSTLERRRDFCHAELALNRRTAPQIYQDVLPVTRGADGALALGGEGTAVDWVVVMRRFDEDGLFDRLAQRNALDVALMERLADEIARFHATADALPETDFADIFAQVIAGNTRNLESAASGIFDPAKVTALDAQSRTLLAQHRDLLAARARDGYVRRCHGDLHLRNICMIDHAPVLFDCIEFNDALAAIDVFYDLAFLLMDLEHRALRTFANAVLNRYLARTGDYGALPLLPLFMSVRAAVRAHVGVAIADKQHDAAEQMRQRAEAAAYLDLAIALLRPASPMLLAVGGLSGSGKSTLARALAPELGQAPGAVVVRSDVIRKQLAGADLFARLPEDAYTRDSSRAVFSRMADICRDALAAGFSAIADGVYRSAGERATIAEVAGRADAPFLGFWLDVSPAVQDSRVSRRKGDVSDASVTVARAQRERIGPVPEWSHLDADTGLEVLLDSARRNLRASIGDL
jgi:aminoglycoside phosphotransferase family enzyme